MKFLKASYLCLALLLLPAGAFAGTNTQKGPLNVAESVEVAGQHLAAGNYTVQWTNPGPTTEVSFFHNGKVVATVTAELVQLQQKADGDLVDTWTTGDGVHQLRMIEFGGKSYALKINNAASTTSSASGSR